MFDTKKIDELTQRLIDALPPGVKSLKDDLEKNFHSILQNAFNKMDLVTRDEFDVQIALLKRTREKVQALEHKIAELEAKKKSKEK